MTVEEPTTPMSSLENGVQTPIASIKRTRKQQEEASPLHHYKPVERSLADKVDTIFSPVAHFFDETDEDLKQPETNFHEEDFNPWSFIASLPAYETVANTRPQVNLPDSKFKHTLVLDLDETLVHCSVEQPDTPADLTFPVNFHNIDYTVYVKLRPHLHAFLESLKNMEVIIFTASQQVYAEKLLNLIDPESKYFHHRLYRDSCLSVEGNYLKDLNVLNRDLQYTVLVDNSPHAFGYQLDNGIPIESWFDDPHDRELLKLSNFLTKSVFCGTDVRQVIQSKFGTKQLVAKAPKYN